MSSENRKNTRRIVRQGARLVGADGSVLGTCQMTDISGFGARLKVGKSEGLPNEFILLLSHNGQLRRQCTVAWREGTVIGVKFLSSSSTKRK